MFHLVVFSCILATAFAFPDVRIHGGLTVDIKDYPYQLSLQRNGKHICGASIISSKWAVTAAHCTNGLNPSEMSIRANSSFVNSGGKIVNVKTIKQNPNFDPETKDYDMSLLEFSSELSFGVGIKAIGLPSSGQDTPVGKKGTVTGWGLTGEGKPLPSQLQAVDVTIIHEGECTASYGSSFFPNTMMCAGEVFGDKDACKGDDGGALVVGNEIIGIYSWGRGCGNQHYPGVYTNVAKLREFITEATGM